MRTSRTRPGIKPALFIVLAACAASLSATNSPPELEAVMQDLMKMLPGEYSTAPQLELSASTAHRPTVNTLTGIASSPGLTCRTSETT